MKSAKELGIRALTFDVFGTVVDWRTSVIAEGQALGREKNIDIDWVAFADAWRGLYQPAMTKVREGEIGWIKLDILHRMNLDQLLTEFGIEGRLSEEELQDFNRAWHRLRPWPDVVSGLIRLKRKYILGTLSNGNVALMVNLAKHSGLPWDVILGAEVAGHYKPQPEAYRNAVNLLDLDPGQVALVAAHNGDLHAAAKEGMRTIFVGRPTEYGPQQTTDLAADTDIDIVADDFNDLAARLGC